MSHSQRPGVLLLEREQAAPGAGAGAAAAVRWRADGGVRQVHLDLPADAVPVALARPWCVPGVITAQGRGGSTLLDVRLDVAALADAAGGALPEVDDARVGEALLVARAELVAGDRRPLALVWLAAVQHGEVEDDALEPPVPAGLGRLSDAQEVVADALGLSVEMVEVAARGGGRRPRRSAGELLHREAVLAWERERAERAARARRAADWALGVSAADAVWAAALVRSSGPGHEGLWRQVEAIVLRGRPQEYRRAATALVALRRQLEGADAADFERRLAVLRQHHAGRGALLATLDRAGLVTGG